jgi:periplasmic divalent cation tolerance protein
METATGCCLVSCAAGSQDNARQIASALVSERLAACVQIMPVESVYRWNGAVQQEPEFLLQAKTTTGRLPAVEALIKRLHTYDLPEIAVTLIVAGSEEYLAWIADCVDPAGEG